jgi:hypothetical protein
MDGQEARGGGSRLIYGYANGVRRGPRRIAFDKAAAKAIDRAIAFVGGGAPRLLVSGFWRSGTTWLQESAAAALGAKTVFEPLSPMEPLRRVALDRIFPDDTEDVRQATIPGPELERDALWHYLDATCRGRIATEYLMSCRRDIAESFCRSIVVKDVRLQANLDGFHRRYGVPIIHVRRHPCAVVASLVAADWHWDFARVGLASLLPRLGGALPADEMASIVRRFDTDRAARIAALWAVTERLAARSLAGQTWGALVSYEAFAATPGRVLHDTFRHLQLRARHAVDFSQPSASVSPEAFAAYRAAPSERWRRELADPEIKRICAIADTIFPEWNDRLEIPTGPDLSRTVETIPDRVRT